MMQPVDIRKGLRQLQEMATALSRTDVFDACDAIISMSDDTLRARQHEIAGLAHLGLNPIDMGYLEAVVQAEPEQ